MRCDCKPPVEQHPLPEVPGNEGCCVPEWAPGCGVNSSLQCSTDYYHLPLWKANSVTSWLYGINRAMIMIDNLFHDFALRTQIDGESLQIVDEVEGLGERMEAVEDQLANVFSDLANVTGQLNTVLSQLQLVENKVTTNLYNTNNLETRVKTLELAGNNTNTELTNYQAAQNEWNSESARVHETLSGQVEALAKEATERKEYNDKYFAKIDQAISKLNALEKRVTKLEG